MNRKAARWHRLWLLFLFVLTLPLVTPRLRGADEIQYFSYLPSVVFDGDLELGDEYSHFYARDPRGLAGFKATFLDRMEPATGRHINFAPVGSAILWSPFYAVAHGSVLKARDLGYSVPADGLSWPYEAAACYASAFYGLLGLLLVHNLLVRRAGLAPDAATATVLAVWYGTPVVYYMTVAPGFSHATSLFAVAALLSAWLSARDRETEPGDAGLNRWALVGLCGGVAGLVREQDALFLLAPAGDLVWRAVRQRRLWRPLGALVMLVVCAVFAFVPQLLAYREINGHFGPSRLVARKMSYQSPHFLEVLFDPAHGLYLWAPLLLFATAGLLLAWRRPARPAGRAVVPWLALAFLAQVWINGAVESWTLAGAFGQRRFVSSTPILAWGLAALVAWGLTRLGRAAVSVVLTLFVWWNLSLAVQFGLKLMDRQGLEWPKVAVNQVTAVPRVFVRAAVLFATDRERLVREGP